MMMAMSLTVLPRPSLIHLSPYSEKKAGTCSAAHSPHHSPRGMKRPSDTSVDENLFQDLVTSVVQRLMTMQFDGTPLLQTLAPPDQQQLIRSTIHQLQPSPHRPDGSYCGSLSPMLTAPCSLPSQAAAPMYLDTSNITMASPATTSTPQPLVVVTSRTYALHSLRSIGS